MNKSKYFKINNSFIAVVSQDTDRDIIKIGNPIQLQSPCVEIHIFKSTSTIYLHGLQYSQKCNITNDLLNGDDGTVIMLKLALSFAIKFYPYCHNFELTDESGYTDDTLRKTVNFSDRDILLYGKTWYQRKLSEIPLRPSNPTYRRNLKIFLKYLDVVVSKNDIDSMQFIKGRYEFVGKSLSQVIKVVHAEDKKQIGKLIVQVMLHFRIATINGMTWNATMDLNTFQSISVKKMKNKPSDLIVQWGGDLCKTECFIMPDGGDT
jgi:hypothetical protein